MDKRMNILVTGACGQLGNELRIVTAQSADHYVFTDVAVCEGVEPLDITDAQAVRKMLNDNDIDVIVNCAAYTDVEKAENDADVAELLNATAVRILAESMAARGGLLIHISTDYVFDGMGNVPYKEDAKPCPSGVYGLTKLHGEQAVLASGCKYIIIRTAWLYSEFGKNFVKTVLKLTAARPSIDVVCDQTGSPTYALDLAETVYRIIENYRRGEDEHSIYHFTDEGSCTWYDFAKQIASLSGHTACEIHPCTSEEYPSKVHRPAYSVLDKTGIKEKFGLEIPHWSESLKKCLANMDLERY